MWPSAPLDFNSMDFLVWFLLKVKICSAAHPDVDALKTSLLSEWDKKGNDACLDW